MSQLILQISVKTELDKSTWYAMLKELFPSGEVSVKESGFDWDAETVVANNSDNTKEIYSIADELYSKLLNNNQAFTDWEYKFISDMYTASEEKRNLTPKQKGWIMKLKEKHL